MEKVTLRALTPLTRSKNKYSLYNISQGNSMAQDEKKKKDKKKKDEKKKDEKKKDEKKKDEKKKE